MDWKEMEFWWWSVGEWLRKGTQKEGCGTVRWLISQWDEWLSWPEVGANQSGMSWMIGSRWSCLPVLHISSDDRKWASLVHLTLLCHGVPLNYFSVSFKNHCTLVTLKVAIFGKVEREMDRKRQWGRAPWDLGSSCLIRYCIAQHIPYHYGI